ncbi:hypothetical protein DSO57_1010518 [Entomophthora muscae]|uniref:Uncharacterized protein n=1 Tax=Entomophthora muscae TaxID=34485 RepID=A0ACC2U4K3_9FUNG|nr:hypothetical protein DSO57_1010518 [Entomophthora muscae]
MTIPSSWSLATIQDTLGDCWTGTPQLLLQIFGAVRIDNSPPLEPQAQEQELNPKPGFPWAAGPMDCRTACRHFSGVKPPQAEAEDDGPSSETDQAKEIIALSGVPIMTPNGGAQATTISFMSLKSTPATNQEPTQGRGTSLQPGPMTTTLEQDNQVAKLESQPMKELLGQALFCCLWT